MSKVEKLREAARQLNAEWAGADAPSEGDVDYPAWVKRRDMEQSIESLEDFKEFLECFGGGDENDYPEFFADEDKPKPELSIAERQRKENEALRKLFKVNPLPMAPDKK